MSRTTKSAVRNLILASVVAGAAAVAGGIQGSLFSISEDEEIKIGAQANEQVREEMGIYTENKVLQRYVSDVGKKLAKKSSRATLDFDFAIVDSPDINAFAIPGGYVYITRGLLARMSSEDELAAVLGHEIGHVAARHSVEQMAKAQKAQLGMLGLSVLSGGKYGQAVTGLAGVAMNAAMSGYSRDDEREADELGVIYMRKAGYNPKGAIDLMESFKALEKREPSKIEAWFASHPQTSERIANISQEMIDLTRKQGGVMRRPILRDPYLRQIDGILYGESSMSGFVSGRRYIGTRGNYMFQVPEGWDLHLSGKNVIAIKNGGGAQAEMKVTTLPRPNIVSGDLAREFAQQAAQQGLQVLGPITKARVPAGEGAVVKVRAADKQGNVAILKRFYLVRFDRSYVLSYITGEDQSDGEEKTFMTMTGSIRFLGPDEEKSYPKPRVRVVTAKQGDTWASLLTTPSALPLKPEELAELNGRGKDNLPNPGLLVKVPLAVAAP